VDLTALEGLISPCRLCPRECGAKRAAGERGFCKCGAEPLVGSVGPHFGEEDVLVGRGGSGTVFFAGCNLGCRFCQNWSLSHMLDGREFSVEEIARAMTALAAQGCENINFVTPTHFAPSVAGAVQLARRWGLSLPIVYNCGGYESVEVLKHLEGLVEIYMPDLKTLDADFAERALLAADYPQRAGEALLEMHRQVGDLRSDETGVARRGLLVRHLVMPGQVEDSKRCLEFLAREISPRTLVNVMGQYRPCGEADRVGGIYRRPTFEEIGEARAHARELGLRLARD
jgi:putative pyruvate formate lyase activating enzyme